LVFILYKEKKKLILFFFRLLLFKVFQELVLFDLLQL
jgi:hypothetical protein